MTSTSNRFSGFSEFLNMVIDCTNQSGRFVQGVTAGDEDPMFFYTIGNSMEEGSYPLEFLMFWHSDSLVFLLNQIGNALQSPRHRDLCRQVDEAGDHGGLLVKGVLGPVGQFGVVLRPLSGPARQFAAGRYACALTNDSLRDAGAFKEHSLWQVIIPDLDGVFPGQEGCMKEIEEMCPLPLMGGTEGWSPALEIDLEDLFDHSSQAAHDAIYRPRRGPRRPHRPSQGFGNS